MTSTASESWAAPEVACSRGSAGSGPPHPGPRPQSDPARDRIYREEFAEHPGEIAAMRFARGFSAFWPRKDPPERIRPAGGFAYRYT
jgi:hypothetical protein